MGRTIKNGRFCIYNGNEFKVNKDSDGNTISSDKPKKAPVIKSITVETYGVDYGTPKTVEEFDMDSWYSNYIMQQYGHMYQ